LRETLEEILSLQTQYSPLNTAEMQRRGLLIRKILPAEILVHAAEISGALGKFGKDLKATGRDATGRKSRVPWVRVFSHEMSPKPGSGWYLVYLFHPDSSGVSLCLSHGSTTPVDGGYRKHKQEEIDRLMGWARAVVGDVATNGELLTSVALGKGKLASAYEKTTLISKFYANDAVPGEDGLKADLLIFAGLLRRLYTAEKSGMKPDFSRPAPKIDYQPNLASYPSVAEPAAPMSLEDARKRIDAQIVARQGGAAFRAEALKRFNNRCAISDWGVTLVLEAAHIVPYLGAETNQPDNALLLRSDLHTLFDRNELTINPDTLCVQLVGDLAKGPYEIYAGKAIAIPQGISSKTVQMRLRERASVYLLKEP